MKKYCFNCGSKLEFSPKNMPKFCQNCGKALASQMTSEDKEEVSAAIGDPEEGSPQVPVNIDGLDFEFDGSSLSRKKETLASLMGTADKKDLNKDDSWQPNVSDVSNEEFLKEFQKEAGTSRQSTPSQEKENDQA